MSIADRTTFSHLSHRVAKNSTVVLFGQVFSLLINIGVTILLARYLGEHAFGLFSYAIVFVSFFAIISDFGIRPILVRELSRKPEQAEIILGNAILFNLWLSILAIFLNVIFAYIFDFSNELRLIIFILATNILITAKLNTFRIMFEAVYQANLQMIYPMIFHAIDALVLIALTFFLIHIKSSLIIITAAYVLSNLPGFVLTVIGSRKMVKPRYGWRPELCRMFFSESSPILIYIVLMTIYDRIDVILLKAIKGEAAVGLYASAYRIVNPLSFIPLAIDTSLFPLMSKYSVSSKENLTKTYVIGIKILLVIGIPIATMGAVLGKKLFDFLYTEPFFPAADAFRILIASQAVLFLNFFFANYHISVDKQKNNLWAALAMCIGSLLLNLLLIPQWGITGAGIAKLLTNIIGFSVFCYFVYRNIITVLAPIVRRIAGIAILFLVWLFAVKSFNLILVGVLSAILYPLLIFGFNIFDQNEKRVLADLLKRIIYRQII